MHPSKIHSYMDLKHEFMYKVTMDYGTFKVFVRKTGLEIKEFACLIGMNPRSISNYSKIGVVPEHLALIALLTAELGRYEVDLRTVFAKLDKIGRQRHKPPAGGFRGKRRQVTDGEPIEIRDDCSR
jgi:hypothetical protein